MSIRTNSILSTDSYKTSHYMQYPEGTSVVFSYGEARGTSIKGVKDIVMFGLQSYIKERLLKPISKADVYEAWNFCTEHGVPFNFEGWMYIVNNHNGLLPVTIRAVEEGTPVPLSNVLFTVENTDPECFWLTSYLETDILRAVWYGSTVATISRECKRIIKAGLEKTADNLDGLPFKLHDFGFRGVSSFESAAIGGAAHLINFMGTDTIAGIGHAMDYYDADVCGYSIPAAEHSTMTMRGRESEQASYQAMIDAYAAPGKIFAVVSDSYDIYNAVENIWIGAGLLEQVKEKGATVVIRPDSGNPLTVPVELINMLWEGTPEKLVNSKGYKLLPPYVRVIQGDGITIESLPIIIDNLIAAGYSTDNIAFGMGGGLLQKVDRDTFKWAMKCSAAVVNGLAVDVYKDPITDHGKRSKKGFLVLNKDEKGNFYTDRKDTGWKANFDYLNTVYFHHGASTNVRFVNFDTVRENAKV